MIKSMPRTLIWLIAIGIFLALSLATGVHTILPSGDGSKAKSDSLEASVAKLTPLDEERWMREVTTTEDGTEQLPSSLNTVVSSVEERIIGNLQQENQILLNGLEAGREQLRNLEVDRELLEGQTQNPDTPDAQKSALDKERLRASTHIRELLETSSQAEELIDEEKELVALASISGYLEIMTRSRLGMSEGLKRQIISTLMPDYSFCLGEGMPFIATTPKERLRLLTYLQTGDETLLDYGHMREDLETITQECFSTLIARINRMIASR